MKAGYYAEFFQQFDPDQEVLLAVRHHLWAAELNQAWPMHFKVAPSAGPVTHVVLERFPDPSIPSFISHVCGVGPLPIVGEIRQRVLLEQDEGDAHPLFKGDFKDEFIRVDWFLSDGNPVLVTRMRKEEGSFVEGGPPGDGLLDYFTVRDGYRPVAGPFFSSGPSQEGKKRLQVRAAR